jgi:hypothetical protein
MNNPNCLLVRYLTAGHYGLCDNNSVELLSAPPQRDARRMNRWAIYYSHGT